MCDTWLRKIEAAVRGRLAFDAKPVDSQRGLAAWLDVSCTTVSEAKRLLGDHGIIAKHEGMYYVA